MTGVPDWAIRTAADRAAIEAGCWWDNDRAERIVKFAHSFFHLKYSHERFRLFAEQELFLRSLEGWRNPNDSRRFRVANLHCCKKLLGKTTLAALLAMYELFASESASPFVICGAAAFKNTEQIYKAIRHAIDKSPFGALRPTTGRNKEYLHIRPLDSRLRLTVPDNGAELWCVASDGDRVHGENTSLVVLDEVHAHKDSTLHDSLAYSTTTRPNGLVVCISTSGDDLNHFYRTEIYAKSKRILSGEDLDPTWYAQVYEADAGCDPEDPAQWVKANPLLGRADFADIDQFRRELQSAKSTGVGKWMAFCRYRLNLWLAAHETAFLVPGDEWDTYHYAPEEETLQSCPAAVGVDLSDSVDPSSVSITWALPDGRFYTRSHAWVCEQGVKDRDGSNLPKYQQYQFGGHLTITPGNMIDADRVRDYILNLCRTYDVRVCNWDIRNSYILARQIADQGYTCERVPPSARHYNAPLIEFRKAYNAGRILHNGSPWLRFCIGNTRIEMNSYDECYPIRGRSVDKIDSFISTLLSYAGLLNQQRQQSSIVWR